MASNTTLNTGTGGDIITTKQRTHDGDTTKQQGVFLSGVTGTEDSYTFTDVQAGGGTEAGALRVTVASDSTGVLSVDDNGGSLTVDGTVAVSTVTTVTTVAAVTAISNALPAGTNNIGDVDILSIAAGDNNIGNVDVVTLPALPAGTNNIGDVDVLSVVPGTGATSLGKAEDAAHASGDTGVMALAVRRDADTTLAATDGDYVPLQCNASGSLKVAITSGAGSGGTSIADGASFTRDTTSITPAGAVVETSAPTLTNGDVAGLSMTTAGALRVNVASGGIAGLVEDAASAGGEEGVGLIVVRRDTPSSGVSADGDFAMLSCNSSGALYVTGGGGGTQYAEDVAHTTGDTGTVALAVRRDTAAVGSGTDGDYSTLNVNSSGRLYVEASIAATQTLSTVTTVSTVTNVATIGTSVTPGTAAANLGKAEDAAHTSGDVGVFALAVRTDTAAASSGTTGDYEALHTDSVGALWNRSTGELADDAAFTPATSRVMPAGLFADETATDSVDEGDIGAARMTLDRKAIVTPYVHAAAGGHTPYYNLDVDESEDAIKASAGKLFWIHVMNRATAPRYIKFYNDTVANVTVGTTTPVLSFMVPTMGDTNGAGFTINFGDAGCTFSAAITVAATTGIADNDTGAPSANDVVLNAGYL